MLAICCSVCGKLACITDPYNDDNLDVNRRSVLAMRTIGKGRAGLATFSGMMVMKPSHYQAMLHHPKAGIVGGF